MTATERLLRELLAMNEALILGSLRQHELTASESAQRKLVESEQKRLSELLLDQQFYTRSLIEADIDALVATDLSGIITDVNKQMQNLTGHTRDELIGSPFRTHFSEPKQAEALINLTLREKKLSDYELTVCDRDGKQTAVSCNATTFYDRDDILQGIFVAARASRSARRPIGRPPCCSTSSITA